MPISGVGGVTTVLSVFGSEEATVQLSSVVPNPGSSDTSHLHHAAQVRPQRDQSWCVPSPRPGCGWRFPRRVLAVPGLAAGLPPLGLAFLVCRWGGSTARALAACAPWVRPGPGRAAARLPGVFGRRSDFAFSQCT